MEQYIVSARKYRPDNFESLIGQDNIAKTLKNSILRGQLAHAYLFCGPRGVGKTSTARIFAKTINCSNPSADMEPCGHCESCLSFAEGRSYCIHELDAASNNGVDDIKALMDQVRIPPQIGKYSVYIIDEVHMLSQSAFNAFLKTLEEPPAHAIFILATTEKHKILPTILSRCQTYDFNRITVDNIVANLRNIAQKENISIDDESLHVIAVKADGAMRDALTIFDQTVAFCGTEVHYSDVLKNLNVLDYEYSFNLVDAFLKGDYSATLLSFDEILSKGFNALHFVSALSAHFRDLIVAKSSGLDALLELPDSLKVKYRQQADKCPLKFLYDALAVTTQCESGYRASVNPRLHVEFALMKLSFLSNASSLMSQPGVAQTDAAVRPASGSVTTASEPSSRVVAAPDSRPASVVNTRQESVQVNSPDTMPTDKTDSSGRTRRRSSRSVSTGMSMSSVNTKVAQESPVEQKVISKVDATEVSDKFLSDKWEELASVYEKAGKARLASAIRASKLVIKRKEQDVELTFSVFNESQKDWIESRCLFAMEGNYQHLAGSSAIHLKVDVIPEEEVVQTAYMPSEKAQELMNTNAEVKNLVQDLGLDVK